jgi:hypothetical protein
MLIVETAFAVGMLCTSTTKRKRAVEDMNPSYAVGNGLTVLPFQASSGSTLENKMTNEIEDMPGVVDVRVKRTGDNFDVLVVMENMDFGPFSGVVEKELALDAKFPEFTFNFELLPAAALEENSALLPNAA